MKVDCADVRVVQHASKSQGDGIRNVAGNIGTQRTPGKIPFAESDLRTAPLIPKRGRLVEAGACIQKRRRILRANLQTEIAA